MAWRSTPRLIAWIEAVPAMYGFHGVGWIAAGYYAEGLLRMVVGWLLLILAVVTMFLMWEAFAFLPGNLQLAAGIPGPLLWVAGGIWSCRSLQHRLRTRVASTPT
jgi:hypothetical protein